MVGPALHLMRRQLSGRSMPTDRLPGSAAVVLLPIPFPPPRGRRGTHRGATQEAFASLLLLETVELIRLMPDLVIDVGELAGFVPVCGARFPPRLVSVEPQRR